MKALLALLPVALIAACATSTPSSTSDSASAAPIDKRVTDAATAPLSDLNLVRAKIPPALLAARHNPYMAPSEQGCAALGNDVQALDAALGPDLDAPRYDASPGLIERGGAEAERAAFGAIQSAAEGLVPYRGWVRKLTGAERHSREVASAIVAGGVRRAYLKGIAHALGCTAPPAPLRAQPAE